VAIRSDTLLHALFPALVHARKENETFFLSRIMSRKTYSVLFLCTHNSARSILAEAFLNQVGKGRFIAYSAGSHPRGKVNPFALELLAKNHLDTTSLRSKSWDEFAQPGSPRMDFVFTVCDQAAGEMCPIWPGQPMTAHWGVDDPGKAEGTDEEKRRAFLVAFRELSTRINLFLSLPLDKLDRLALTRKLADIGQARVETRTQSQ